MKLARLALAVPLLAAACGGAAFRDRPITGRALKLDRVVLYRNGVGYFERRGKVAGNVLTLKVRKDQVNDLLKSLTVIDRGTGKALSISIPLDPRTWQQVANAAFSGQQGKLADVLSSLRGTYVEVRAKGRPVAGRIVMIERIAASTPGEQSKSDGREDAKLTLLDDGRLHVVTLSEVESIGLGDRDVVLQLGRRLDASAGEGMFQQVDVSIRLGGRQPHDVVVSYVVAAPIWKPTYRVVLADDGSDKALLQGWAVVDNTSGENWNEVRLSLTSGTPIAFRYDLHTPEEIERVDLTSQGTAKRARAAVGRASSGEYYGEAGGAYGGRPGAAAPPAAVPAPSRSKAAKRDELPAEEEYSLSEASPAIDMDAMAASIAPRVQTQRVAGMTRFDLGDRVVVPDGSATMVTLVNQVVPGEQTFLYRPGGSGAGYEANPYRVIRFKNQTEFVLEPGPIGVFQGGSFVGEGISETIAAAATATIPFAVEPQIAVTSNQSQLADQVKLVKIANGVLEIERFYQTTTEWEVKGMKSTSPYRVIAQQAKQGGNYKVSESPKGIEDLGDVYLVPIDIAAGATTGSAKVVEQTPVRTTISIWDGNAPELLTGLLASPSLPAATRRKLEPIVRDRQELGKLDTRIDGLKRAQRELDQRAAEMRQNLEAIKKDPKADALRKQLTARMDEFSQEGNKIGREIVTLTSQRLEKKIAIDDALRNLTIAP